MNKIKTENLFKHITLFSIVGILTIALNDYFSFIAGIDIPKWFSSQTNMTFWYFIISILIIIFLNGYFYKYANELFKNDNAQIPEVSLECFTAFIKMLPVFSLWYIYFFAGALIGFGLFEFGSLASTFYYSIIGVLMIFINALFVLYAKDFKIKREFFRFNMLKNIIEKTFFKVTTITAETILLIITTVYLLFQIYLHSTIIKIDLVYFATMLLALCIGGYVVTLIHLFYIKKLVKIFKELQVSEKFNI